MSKTLLFFSLISLTFLIAGSILFPSSSVMWLASSSLAINILRSVLAVITCGFLVTDPPRNPSLRMVVGFLAVGTAVWSSIAAYNNTLPLLDGASLLLASIALGAVALELHAIDLAEDAYNEAAQAAITRTAAQH